MSSDPAMIEAALYLLLIGSCVVLFFVSWDRSSAKYVGPVCIFVAFSMWFLGIPVSGWLIAIYLATGGALSIWAVVARRGGAEHDDI